MTRFRLVVKVLHNCVSISRVNWMRLLTIDYTECRKKRPHCKNFNIFKTVQQFYTKFSAVIKEKIATDRPRFVQYYESLR